MIPCIEYTRASTARQEYSVGDQDKNIRAWADRNNYKIVRSYCDDGISGHYAAKRPGFLSMIEDITVDPVPERSVSEVLFAVYDLRPDTALTIF